MKRLLHIAEPCHAHWDAMPGTEQKRHCEDCGKQVHALSEMTEREAEQLLAAAPPSVCVRIEHDEAGRVRFRSEASNPPKRTPALLRAVGTTLLVAACGRGDPGATQESVTSPPAARATAPAHAASPSAASSSAAAAAMASASTPAATAEGASAVDTPALGASSAAQTHDPACAPTHARAASSARSPKAAPPASSGSVRVTMGCLCAPGDALCDCL